MIASVPFALQAEAKAQLHFQVARLHMLAVTGPQGYLVSLQMYNFARSPLTSAH